MGMSITEQSNSYEMELALRNAPKGWSSSEYLDAVLDFCISLTMPRCTNKGCLKEYDEADNAEGSCQYHPGGPVRALLKLQRVS